MPTIEEMKLGKAIVSISLLFFSPLSLFSLDETIILGMDDQWKSMTYTENVRSIPGKRGYQDLVLQDAEYSVTPETDLLLHLNSGPPIDAAGKYRVNGSAHVITSAYSVYGGGAALFRNWKGGLQIAPRENALLSPGTEWNDFTIEFWLYPAALEDDEIILSWNGVKKTGNKNMPQSITCRVEDRKLHWIFSNLFIPPDNGQFTITLAGTTPLVPKRWNHHTVRFDGDTGLLEYTVNGNPEAITYATATKQEAPAIFYPSIGNYSRGPLEIAPFYTGIIDEVRFSTSFIKKPTYKKYTKTAGSAISKPIDLGYSNSKLITISADDTVPGNADIFYFYIINDSSLPSDAGWSPFSPGSFYPNDARGRFLHLKVELYPTGEGKYTPSISDITVTYEPDLPPPPPSLITATAGNNEVTLQWKPVAEADIAGYSVYYGTESGRYIGTAGDQPSPIDVGNTTSVTIERLENGTLYFFSVVSYDSSTPHHFSGFSKEVSARPSGLGIQSNGNEKRE